MNLNLMMKYLTSNQVGHDNQIILIFTKHKLGKIPYSSPGGGRHPPEILITLANHLICGKDFLRVPLFYPRIPKNRRLKIFRPPFVTR